MLKRRLSIAAVVLALVAGACGKDSDNKDSSATAGAAAPVRVRLGYLANLTHATALVGINKGIFETKLGTDKLETQFFNAGGDAVTALLSDAIDAAYVGPNPAINAWSKSSGTAIKIISGATSGGAFLVVKPDITKPEQLKGKTLATPQLGNTQDVALRWWLKGLNLKTDTSGGGDVKIVPQDNAQSLQTFLTGDIQGAWLPEPWATRLVQEGGAKILISEQDLWETGDYVTTHLIVSPKFLKAHPDAVKRLLEGQVAANDYVNDNPAESQTLANAQIEKDTGKKLAPAVITAAWKNLHFTNDPIAASLTLSAKHAEDVGLLQPVDLKGIYDLKLLNEVLKKAGEDTVSTT